MSPKQILLPHGFIELPVSRDLSDCDAVVLGVPFDLATTGRAGARDGPNGIRRASWHISWEERRWPWRFKLTDRTKIIDYGDVDFETGQTEQMIDTLREHARTVLEAGKTLLCLGGDHFVSLPLIQEHAARFGRLSLIHFDAHADTEPIKGSVNHGSMFKKAMEDELIDPAHSVQIGIRTEYEYEDYPLTVLSAAWVNDRSAGETAAAIRRVVGDRPVYLTFDIDCLDPAYAPGTGTPSPGGLTTDLALKILRELAPCRIVGMDVVEVAPGYDHAEITALAAASIAMELLYVLAADESDLERLHGWESSSP
jgi:agmatinase